MESMFERHPAFEEPPETAHVWRYMSFGRYVSLLSRQALYFCRADKLQDIYEGRLPKPTYEGTHERLRAGYEDKRHNTILNCWSLGEYESVALWHIYVPSHEGVAIRSSFGRLKDSFRVESLYQDARVHIGLVRYIDFNQHDFVGPDRTAFNTFIPLMHKRRYFEYEREVRAVISGLGTSLLDTLIRQSDGLYVPISLSGLIESIHVAPDAPFWLLEVVRHTTKIYGLDPALVIQSGLDEPPPGYGS